MVAAAVYCGARRGTRGCFVCPDAAGRKSGGCQLSTTNALDDGFEEAEKGLEWLERLEALQARSASDKAAFEVVDYVVKLRTAVTALAGDRTRDELSQTLGEETAQLVAELRHEDGQDYWSTKIRPALLKSDP